MKRKIDEKGRQKIIKQTADGQADEKAKQRTRKQAIQQRPNIQMGDSDSGKQNAPLPVLAFKTANVRHLTFAGPQQPFPSGCSPRQHLPRGGERGAPGTLLQGMKGKGM